MNTDRIERRSRCAPSLGGCGADANAEEFGTWFK